MTLHLYMSAVCVSGRALGDKSELPILSATSLTMSSADSATDTVADNAENCHVESQLSELAVSPAAGVDANPTDGECQSADAEAAVEQDNAEDNITECAVAVADVSDSNCQPEADLLTHSSESKGEKKIAYIIWLF